MERRRTAVSEASARLESGRRLELEAASKRIGALRSGIALRREAQGSGDDDLGERALQEIDVAHEELRVLEEELHTQADELIAARERSDRDRRIYAELFEAAPDAYLVTDERGTVIQVNRHASLLFDRDAAFLIGKPLAALLVPEDRAALRVLVDEMSDAVFRTELRIQPRKEAVRRWVSLTAQRGVRDESSICIRWLIRDVTTQKEDEALRSANEELLRDQVRALEERTRREDHVLAEVAHELRTPLGAVAGWLHVLSEKTVSEAAKSRAVFSMVRQVRSIAHTVDELIDHARVENHRVTLDITPINLLRLVIEVVEDLRALAELKGIQFDLAAKDHQIVVHGDLLRLQQVLRGVIGNAIKFTSEHGVIRVSVSVSNQRAEVAISDTGRGIPREALLRIFAPFAKVSTGKRHTGLGLGLSVAKRLIELHGGSISVESAGAQCGATFRICLPLFAPN